MDLPVVTSFRLQITGNEVVGLSPGCVSHLPFEDALKAATEVKPPEKSPRKPRQKKGAQS